MPDTPAQRVRLEQRRHLVAAARVALLLPCLGACARTGFAVPPDPCAAIDCDGVGTCQRSDLGPPVCVCDPGYVRQGETSCVARAQVVDAGAPDRVVGDAAMVVVAGPGDRAVLDTGSGADAVTGLDGAAGSDGPGPDTLIGGDGAGGEDHPPILDAATGDHSTGADAGPTLPVADQLLLHLDAARARAGGGPQPAGCPAGALDWTDLSPSGADGTLVNFAGCDASSGWNGTGTAADPHRLVLRGSDDNLVDLGSDLFNGAEQGTVEAWYRMDTPPARTGDDNTSGHGLLAAASASNDLRFFAVAVFSAAVDQPRLNAWCRTPFNVVHGAQALPASRWLHLAVTSDGAITRLFVNAVEESTTAIDGSNQGDWFADAVDGTMRYSVGRVRRASHSNTFIPDDSALAILRLHGRALTPAELLANCQAEQSRFAGARCGP